MGKFDENDVKALRESFAERPTKELLAIWTEGDTAKYRPAAFEAIRRELIARGSPPPAPSVPRLERERLTASAVRIVDIKIPFGSMVIFMVKWSIAAIPAMIIVLLFWTIFGTFVMAFLTA